MELVDIRDLKSREPLNARVGSIPTPGTMKFEYGDIVTPPENFIPREMWPEYGYVSDPPSICRREEVGTEPAGIRWGVWPLIIEEYFGDTEPDLTASAEGRLSYNRIVRWKRILNTNIPKGWKELSKKTWRVDGFFPLERHESYADFWQKNARRDLSQWKEKFLNKSHVIESISLSEYAESYGRSTVARRTHNDRLHDLLRKKALPIVQKNMDLWGVRNIKTGEIVAGMAIIHSPTFQSSSHYSPFILPEGARVYAATALMNHWFEEGLRHKEKFLVTTNFWYQGLPKSWKGFSEFKSHFGWQYVAYPPQLIRFVRGKFL